MSQPPFELQGTWEEILTHAEELSGQQVRVTVLPSPNPTPRKYQSALDMLDERKRNPLSEEEIAILDDFEQFQKEHPFRIRPIEDTP